MGLYLNGDGISGRDPRGQRVVDDHFLLYFNADGPTALTLPPAEYADRWDVVVDTGDSAPEPSYDAGAGLELAERSLLVLRQHRPPEEVADVSVAASLEARTAREEA